jgi:hypothetical protein
MIVNSSVGGTVGVHQRRLHLHHSLPRAAGRALEVKRPRDLDSTKSPRSPNRLRFGELETSPKVRGEELGMTDNIAGWPEGGRWDDLLRAWSGK